jgi:hypothetical protein
MLDNAIAVLVPLPILVDINMWRMAEAGYKRHYRVVHQDVVGLYLSANTRKHLATRPQVLTFVLTKPAADAPSIRSLPAGRSSCALQSEVHCIGTRE